MLQHLQLHILKNLLRILYTSKQRATYTKQPAKYTKQRAKYTKQRAKYTKQRAKYTKIISVQFANCTLPNTDLCSSVHNVTVLQM